RAIMTVVQQRVVLITGAARGIGAATARRLAAGGARLVVADLDGAAVDKPAGELGGAGVAADVTRAADVARMIEEPYRRWGRLDGRVNDASSSRVHASSDVSAGE